MRVAPIDRLLAIMRGADMAANREFLSYAVAHGVVTPEYLLAATGSDEAYELAEEIRELDDSRKAWEAMRAARSLRRGRKPKEPEPA